AINALKSMHIHIVFVRIGSASDRLWFHYPHKAPMLDGNYHPELGDMPSLQQLAVGTGGGYFTENQIGDAVSKVESLAGSGPDYPAEPVAAKAEPLGTYFALAILPFLAYLLGLLLPFTAPLGWWPRVRQRLPL